MKYALVALFLLGFLACGAPESQAPVSPSPTLSEPAPAPLAPEVQRFADTYRILFCKCNYGYDPDIALGTLRDPIQYMKKLEGDKSDMLVAYLKILTDHGYATVGDFDARAAEVRQDGAFWSGFQAQLLDGLKTCR
jgi:hypothetical protein